MSPKTKKSLIKNAWQFAKLQLASNILFWGTYGGYALFDKFFGISTWPAIAIPSLVAHALYFIVDRNWVFSDKTGKRKAKDEVFRFMVFMGLNYFINIGLIAGLQAFFDVTPYIGQFLASFFFTFWTWAGLKFWVFRHARHARGPALTIETRSTNAKRHAKYQRLEAKQKAKRATRVHR